MFATRATGEVFIASGKALVKTGRISPATDEHSFPVERNHYTNIQSNPIQINI